MRSLLRGDYGSVDDDMFSWQPVNDGTKARTGQLKAGALAETYQHIYDQLKGRKFPSCAGCKSMTFRSVPQVSLCPCNMPGERHPIPVPLPPPVPGNV